MNAVMADERMYQLDQLLADAWPSAIVERVGQWRLRWAWGLTRRANSVAVLGPPPGPMDRIVDRAEAFYGAQGLPAVFQVSDLTNGLVTAELQAQGYEPTSEVGIVVAAIDGVAGTASSGWKVVLHARPSDEWFATYWAHEGSRWTGAADMAERAGRVYRSTFLRPRWPHAFAEVWSDGDVVAVGQGIATNGWAGVQCVVTAPAWQRQGAATAVLGALAEWADTIGTRNMFLAVETDNLAARRLSVRAGFVESHRHAYWAPVR